MHGSQVIILMKEKNYHDVSDVKNEIGCKRTSAASLAPTLSTRMIVTKIQTLSLS